MARAPRGRSLSIGSLVQSKPTRARIHRRHELEAGGHLYRATRACDRNPAFLEWLTKRLAGGTVEFRQLVEEQHAVMGARHLAGRHPRPPTHECGIGGCVVGRPEGPPRHEAPDRHLPRHRGDHRCLLRLGGVERRQQPADGSREQGLAGSRRADHEQRVAPGNGDLERSARLRLAADIREVRPAIVVRRWRNPHGRLIGDQLGARDGPTPAHSPAADELHRLPERCGRQRLDCWHEARLVKRIGRYDHASGAAPGERDDHRQQPGHRPDFPPESQLPEHGPAAVGSNLLGADEDGDRDPQVQRGAGLWDVCRGEVHRDPAGRMDEAGIA